MIDLALPPWRRVPKDWRCATCLAQATGYSTARGVVVFFCVDEGHRLKANQFFWNIPEIGGFAGLSQLRVSWRYWLVSRYLLAHRRLDLRGRREWKRQEELTVQIFGKLESDQGVLRLLDTRSA